MTTTDQVFLYIVASLLSLLFLLGIAVLIIVIKLLKSVKRVVMKAEGVVDSVEEVAEVFTEASGPLTLFKLIKNIAKLSAKRGRQ